MKIALGALGSVLLLSGCNTAQESMGPPPAPPMADAAMGSPLQAPTYLAMAGSGDQFEIQSSQMAMQVSQNPAVRSYAQMLIADHTRLSAQTMETARSAGINPPPPTLLPQHQALLDQLRSAGQGPAFDAAYRDAQVNAHQQALQLHQNYASGGDLPALRATASQAVPIIQQHLAQAQNLLMAQGPAGAPMPMPMPSPRTGERG